MALTKETVVDQITVDEKSFVMYREATRIMEDGVQLSQTFHRNSLAPGNDLAGQDPKVAAIAKAVWTKEVVAAYKAAQEANTPTA